MYSKRVESTAKGVTDSKRGQVLGRGTRDIQGLPRQTLNVARPPDPRRSNGEKANGCPPVPLAYGSTRLLPVPPLTESACKSLITVKGLNLNIPLNPPP